MKAVVYWPETEQVSVVSMGLIDESDRYQDAVTTIKCGTRYHRAVVKLISSDERVLKEKADEISEEIEEKEKKEREAELNRQGRGQRSKKSVSVPGSAPANQVSSALGERLKPTPQQADKVKTLSQSKKDTEKAQREAQDEVDRRVLTGTSNKSKSKTSVHGSRASAETGNKSKPTIPVEENSDGRRPHESHEVLDCNNGSSSTRNRSCHNEPAEPGTSGTGNKASASRVSKQLFSGDDDSADEDDFSSDDNNNVEFSDSENKEKNDNFENCCEHCKALRKSYHQSGALFVQALGVYVNSSSGVGVQFAELLDIPADVPKVEITKKSKVFITVADKNAIKADGAGDPSKMTRMALIALFGRQALEQNAITAKGHMSGTLGIHKNVRSAIRAFVNRNKGSTFAPLTEAQFHRVINRKKSQVHRARKSPLNQKKQTKSPKKKTPQKGKKTTPLKGTQESRSLAAIRRSPFSEEDMNSATIRSMSSQMPRGEPQAACSAVQESSTVIASPSKDLWSVSAHPVSHGSVSQGGLTGFNYSVPEGQGSYQHNEGGYWYPQYYQYYQY